MHMKINIFICNLKFFIKGSKTLTLNFFLVNFFNKRIDGEFFIDEVPFL